jgi:GNAT superfamily N-acetyltransferase
MSDKFFSIHYKFEHYLCEDNEFANVDELFGTIYMTPGEEEDEDIELEIGLIELHLYNVSLRDLGYSVYDAFDRSMHTFPMGVMLIREEDDIIKPYLQKRFNIENEQDILVINKIELLEKHRGKGYGREILNALEKSFYGRCGCIVLKSFPLQYECSFDSDDFVKKGFLKAQRSLNKFYKKCGYLKMSTKENYFIKSL